MAAVQDRIVCYTEDDVQKWHKQIWEWLLVQIKVHFLLISDEHTACCMECYEAIRGRNPKVKIILIDPKLDIEVNALAAVFYKGYPELRYSDEAAVGDRSCPFCGKE